MAWERGDRHDDAHCEASGGARRHRFIGRSIRVGNFDSCISSLLFTVSATDPATFVIIPLILAAVALVASYIPADEATRVDPMVALAFMK